jgi:YggT family protein
VILLRLIDLYTFIVFAAVVASWIPALRDSAIGRFIDSATEPVFAQVRKVIPPLGGLDLSPMIVLIALHLLKRLLRGG